VAFFVATPAEAKLSAATGVTAELPPPAEECPDGAPAWEEGDALSRVNAEGRPPLRCGVVIGDIVPVRVAGVLSCGAARPCFPRGVAGDLSEGSYTFRLLKDDELCCSWLAECSLKAEWFKRLAPPPSDAGTCWMLLGAAACWLD